MESCNEEEKELLMRVVKHIRCDPEKFWTNLQYNDRKVTAAPVKISKIVSHIRTETITETNSALCVADNIVTEMVGTTRNRQPNGQRTVLEKQKALRKELRQLNWMRWESQANLQQTDWKEHKEKVWYQMQTRVDFVGVIEPCHDAQIKHRLVEEGGKWIGRVYSKWYTYWNFKK